MNSSSRLTGLLVCSVFLLTGCVVGQSLDMNYQPASSEQVGGNQSVVTTVTDARPFVTSGDKPPHFIGQYRAGFGIPYDVSTDGDVPLADLIERDVDKDLSSLGFALADSGKRLNISIDNWDFDAYQNGRFQYAFTLDVVDGNGQILHSVSVSDDVTVKGTFWTGGKGGFEKAMPQLYRDAIVALVRDNAGVLDALAGR